MQDLIVDRQARIAACVLRRGRFKFCDQIFRDRADLGVGLGHARVFTAAVPAAAAADFRDLYIGAETTVDIMVIPPGDCLKQRSDDRKFRHCVGCRRGYVGNQHQ